MTEENSELKRKFIQKE